jgi:deazaflavin-dependent oxidoreductase (nitroreductase family)
MTWSQRTYGRISPRLAHGRFSAHVSTFHAHLIRKTTGKVGARFFGGAPLLVLRTVGRKGGEIRENPAIYVTAGAHAWAVAASNAASKRFPAWYLNLQANPEAEALVEGKWRHVRARRAEGREFEELTARIEETYEGAKHYATIATRELPIVVLEEQ